MSDTRIYDVIVVGAGLSGLTAAHRIMLSGRSALVLEASQQVGGKVKTDSIEGTTIESGGQWISSRHVEMLQLVKDLGLEIAPKAKGGKHIFADNGRSIYFDGYFPGPSLFDRLNVQHLARRLEQKSRAVDLETPWNSKLAGLDQLSYIQLIKHHLLSIRGLRFVKPILEARLMSGMEQVSALEGLVHWSGLPHSEKYQVIGGAEQIPTKLAWEVDIAFGHKVTQIARNRNHLSISTQCSIFKSRKVVVALPPYEAENLRYLPGISSSKTRFWKSVETGRIRKCNIIFTHPWWKNADWSGEAFCSQDYAFQYLEDSSPSTQGPGILSTYTIGSRCAATDKLTAEQLQEFILLQVRQVLGSSPFEEPLSISMEDWKSPPNGAGAFTTIPPGILTMYGEQISRNEGPIYWASAEYDHMFRGTMEGAIRSGLAASTQVLTIYGTK